jgi:hypothetical protein
MKVTNITRNQENQPRWARGVLTVTELTPERIEVEHTNDDDDFFWYKYEVVGTPAEIATITQFCNQLTGSQEP